MIKEMRYKFILVTFSSLLLIVLILLGTIYSSVSYTNQRQMHRRMESVLKNNGNTLKNGQRQINSVVTNSREEFLNSTFAVKVDKEMNIRGIVGFAEDEYPDISIRKLLDGSLRKGKMEGSIGDLKYLAGEKRYGYLIVYSDYSEQNYLLDNLFKICLVTGIAGCLLIGIFIINLSHWVVGPAEKALSKQKQFISNASHELRTPLTVISANAELLDHKYQDNKWIKSIKSNTERMNELVNSLLDLSRLESPVKKVEFKTFQLSRTVLNAVLSMESVAYEQKKELETDIKENISYYGDGDKIKELVTVLLDNALKYSDEKGNIRVTLFEKSKKPVLEVFNTGDTIPEEDADKIFDRFYRGNSEKEASAEGFGLGLSIAEAVVNMHRGKIYFENIEGAGVKFIVIL